MLYRILQYINTTLRRNPPALGSANVFNPMSRLAISSAGIDILNIVSRDDPFGPESKNMIYVCLAITQPVLWIHMNYIDLLSNGI